MAEGASEALLKVTYRPEQQERQWFGEQAGRQQGGKEEGKDTDDVGLMSHLLCSDVVE